MGKFDSTRTRVTRLLQSLAAKATPLSAAPPMRPAVPTAVVPAPNLEEYREPVAGQPRAVLPDTAHAALPARRVVTVICISCRRFMPVVVLLGVVGVAACTAPAEKCTALDTAQQNAQWPPGAAMAPDAKPDLSGCKRTGIASFYAKKFTGRKMADGTRMDPNADNAASRTLPLGTTAKVTNLATGQSAQVTIQDRGPYVKGRIIDLSPATAREIGLDRQDGITTVVVTPIEVPLPDGGVKQGAAAGDKTR